MAAVAAAGLARHARYTAPYRPVLERVALPAGGRYRGLTGLRIGFVSDTHVGPVFSTADVDRAMTLLFTADPDIVLLGGDYLSESPRYAPEAASVLGSYVSASRLGMLAVLGNHDYSNDDRRVMGSLEKRGIQVLRNASARVTRGGEAFWVIGIDDALLGRPDLARAFEAVPESAAAIALWHEPDWAEAAARSGALLQVSGHSHGGQVRLPLFGNLAAPTGGRRFVSGLNAAAGMPVYTSRGVGIFRPPVRFRCSPEVTLLTFI
jgi:predicted MPP superfamily phosphohydrolase